MYKIYADGECLYDPSLAADKAYAAYSPHVSKEINLAGSASFVLPKENRMYEGIEMLKTIITVTQDDIEIFRGRVMDVTVDSFLQKSVYAEGELAYLIDSIRRPYEYNGNVQALFREYIENHNAQVDSEKQFTPGEITAVEETETTHVKNTGYAQTFSEIQARLLDVYGGYLRAREADGARYIDWVSSFGADNTQAVQIGVNLIDLQAGGNSTDIFTVLIPLGASVQGSEEARALTIASVNNGLDYIEDAEAVARYGRIVRTYTWSHVEDAAELLEKAREYLAYGITANATLQIKAIDMHLLDATIERIDLGSNVQILSDPHGISRFEICAAIDIDLEAPENTTYTFGEPKKTLSENVVRVNEKMGGGGGGGGGTGLEEETLWLQRWAELYVTANEANILMLTGQIDSFAQRISTAEVEIDGVEAQITLTTAEIVELEERTTKCESQIAINKDNIALRVEKNGVISAINQSAEAVTISASKINLEGYVTASEFSATLADITYNNSLVIETALVNGTTVQATTLKASSFTLAENQVQIGALTMGSHVSESVLSTTGEINLAHSHAVSVSDDGTVTLGEVSETGGNFRIADTKTYKDGVSAARTSGINSVTLSASGWESGVNTVTASNGKTQAISLPSFSTSGGTSFTADHKTTVYFSTASVNAPLASATVDASSVYQAGYEAGAAEAGDAEAAYTEGYAAGWAAAKAMASVSRATNVITVKLPSATVDVAAADTVYTVGTGGSISSIRNTAANVFYAQGTARAYITTNSGSAVAVATTNLTKTQTINVGQ